MRLHDHRVTRLTIVDMPTFVKRPTIAIPKIETDKELFAERLRIALAKKNWKPAQLSREVGVSRASAADWVAGRAYPKPPVAARLPAALGVTAEWLFPQKDGVGTSKMMVRESPRGIAPSATAAGVGVRSSKKQWETVAQSVAESWRRLILERKLAFTDVLQILAMERDWLRNQAELRSDPRLQLAADDVQHTINSIKEITRE